MYVDGRYDRDKDIINIVERDCGQRVYKEFRAKHIFYYEDPAGKFRNIFGEACTQFRSNSKKEWQQELKARRNQKLFESDISPIVRCLEDNYKGKAAPVLHTAFFDIETNFEKHKYANTVQVRARKKIPLVQSNHSIDTAEMMLLGDIRRSNDTYEVWSGNTWVNYKDSEYAHFGRGFAPTTDPFNSITAISVYLDWVQQMVTLVMPPDGMTDAEAEAIAADFPNTLVFRNEKDLLNTFLDLIDDADVLSGWNSEGYDIPYVVNRVASILSKSDTRRLCLWNELPSKRTFERYGAESTTYDLIGRVHLDYMQLYRKYTYEERHSYALDAIGDYELGERKTPYEGTLDQLYNDNWRTFIEYNRQDVALLAKLDKKLKFLDLANQIAHENTVLLPASLGAVAVTEQAIINEAHEKGLVVQNRTHRATDEPTEQAAGAYVAYPKKGLHDWIGSVDINSLYPSVLRALNMAPETIIGQIRPDRTDAYIASKMAVLPSGRKGDSFAASWEGLFGSLEYELVMAKDRSEVMIVDWEGADSLEMTGAQIWDLVFNSNSDLVLSANGTIFTLSRAGIIPGLLERWYAERKELQKTLKNWIDLDSGIVIPERLL